jgi:hypothetical protein
LLAEPLGELLRDEAREDVVGPPAANGTMMRTGRTGYASAAAARWARASATPAAAISTWRRVML